MKVSSLTYEGGVDEDFTISWNGAKVGTVHIKTIHKTKEVADSEGIKPTEVNQPPPPMYATQAPPEKKSVTIVIAAPPQQQQM
jgi:hypothetical protein